MRKPFFNKSRKRWMVHLNGKQITLGADKDESFRKYCSLLASQQTGVKPLKSKPADHCEYVHEVMFQFLEWSKLNQAPKTYQCYKFFIDRFTNFIGKVTLEQAKAMHVTRWLQDAGFRQTTANCAVRSLMRPMNWASKQGIIKENPFKGVERPSAIPRDSYISREGMDKVLEHVKGKPWLKLMIEVMRETGCRPQEIRSVEARHFSRRGRNWTFPVTESKGKKRQRVVVLPDRSFEICEQLAVENPKGPLFLTKQGVPWKTERLIREFLKISAATGVQIHPYAIRHTFATDALIKGIEPMVVATLMGHTSIEMLWSVYQKIRLQHGHLAEVAKLAAEQ